MTTSISATESNSNPSRIAVSARLIPALSYAIPAIGAALSSFLVTRVFQGMKSSEGTGMSAVTGGLSEANLAVLVTLYLAIICGVAGIAVSVVRLMAATTTVSPSAWFFLIGGGLGLIPVALLWQAESIVIQVISPASRNVENGNIASTASTIVSLLILTLVVGAVSVIVLLASSVWPLTSRSKPKWAPLVALMVLELVLIVAAVTFQIRTSWLSQVALTGPIVLRSGQPNTTQQPGGEGIIEGEPTEALAPSPPLRDERESGTPKFIRKSNEALQREAIRRVDPTYPPLARAARVWGTVVVEVTIDENGNVESARAVSGHPLLKDAAVQAARGWKFPQTKQRGLPVRVIGSMTFNFQL